jgi:hypothetical protein
MEMVGCAALVIHSNAYLAIGSTTGEIYRKNYRFYIGGADSADEGVRIQRKGGYRFCGPGGADSACITGAIPRVVPN